MHVDTPQQLVQVILAAGFSQAEIAAGTNLSQSTISRIKSGRQDTRVGALRKIEQFAARHASRIQSASRIAADDHRSARKRAKAAAH